LCRRLFVDFVLGVGFHSLVFVGIQRNQKPREIPA
jgi:hypothetical protein